MNPTPTSSGNRLRAIHPRRHLMWAAVTAAATGILLLTGCGAGTGAGGAPAPGTPPPTLRTLGSRAVPGGMVTVTTADALSAGGSATLHIVLDGFASGPAAVEGRLGAMEYDPSATLTAARVADGGYDLSLIVPEAATRAWVRLTFADGSVVETGAEDFPIVR